MFVTQVPVGERVATFGNHKTGMDSLLRGGDLMIRYPNGTLRNLTKEAGYGLDGGNGDNAIAVREPSIHWNGTKAVFAMVVGSPTENTSQNVYYWQLYEATGFGQGQTISITKVANQPADYNNISPVYASDDRILFTSDRPRSGNRWLYPNKDEYESSVVTSGIWSLNPATGDLHILNHSPSGAFSPIIDSFGRVVFTRWDHLQRDQGNDARAFKSVNYASEDQNATVVPPEIPQDTDIDLITGAVTTVAGLDPKAAEVFPEPRDTYMSAYGLAGRLFFNGFTPWEINQDGSEEETLNHIGRHEGGGAAFIQKTFQNSAFQLEDNADASLTANTKTLITDGGLFNLREDPTRPGEFLAIETKEFGSRTTDQIVRLTGAPTIKADAMVLTDVTVPGTGPTNASPGGRFRNPLPLFSGKLVATYSPATQGVDQELITDFRLKLLHKNTSSGLYEGVGTDGTGTNATLLTNPEGIVKTVVTFNPNNFGLSLAERTFSGPLWEMEAVEVVARAVPPLKVEPALEQPEADVFNEAFLGTTATVAEFKAWLASRNLSLIVMRNLTRRDRADMQQPFNLRVPGGVTSKSTTRPNATVFDISHLQLFQADQIRADSLTSGGRRNIAQVLHDPNVLVVPGQGGPAGSVKIGLDGSAAAIVPARRALAWQTVDPNGAPVVRERMWITTQPGEVRVCAGCHGANSRDQTGATTITNKPEALRALLASWLAGR